MIHLKMPKRFGEGESDPDRRGFSATLVADGADNSASTFHVSDAVIDACNGKPGELLALWTRMTAVSLKKLQEYIARGQ